MKHILITAGDPYGVGPEAIRKALKKINSSDVKFMVIGEACGLKGIDAEIVNVDSKYKAPAEPGPSKRGGDISFRAVKTAVDIMLNGNADALVTAPISKEAWRNAGVKFTGHTEVLKKYAAKQGALMMFTSGKLNCALATEHYPIKNLSEAVTKKRIKDAVKIFASQLPPNAEIAVGSLNPHKGDGGKLGDEEIKIITPAVRELKAGDFNVSGPYANDALWLRHSRGQFGGIVMMYHDVALTGLKLAAKEPVVHITAGLKFLRVSPAHGTAFDAACRNKVDASGMLAAINYAINNCK